MIHRALDRAHTLRLDASTGPLELATVSEALLDEVSEALAEGYRKRAEHAARSKRRRRSARAGRRLRAYGIGATA